MFKKLTVFIFFIILFIFSCATEEEKKSYLYLTIDGDNHELISEEGLTSINKTMNCDGVNRNGYEITFEDSEIEMTLFFESPLTQSNLSTKDSNTIVKIKNNFWDYDLTAVNCYPNDHVEIKNIIYSYWTIKADFEGAISDLFTHYTYNLKGNFQIYKGYLSDIKSTN